MKREKVLWCLLWTALVIGVSALISWCISWNLVMQQTGVPGKTLAGLPQAAQTAWLASANAGTYVLLPSGADAASAILQINADSNRTAVLATFDASGKAVSQNGSWHADGDGNLAVSLAPAADSSQPAELTFAIKNGSLTLKDPSGVSWNSANAALVKSDLPLESEWTLRETKLPDGSARTLNSAKPFIAALHADGTVSVQGDCNTLVGSFRLRANHAIGINLAASTRKFCSGSQEDNFTSDLNSAESYRVDGNTLVLNLPASGSMTFTRRIKQNAPAATLKPNSIWVWTGSAKPFLVTFGADGKLNVQGDCNTMSGTYTLGDNNEIAVGAIATTLKYCEGSQESQFLQKFNAAQSYELNPIGILTFNLADGSTLVLTSRER